MIKESSAGGSNETAPNLVVVVDWIEELKAKVSGK